MLELTLKSASWSITEQRRVERRRCNPVRHTTRPTIYSLAASLDSFVCSRLGHELTGASLGELRALMWLLVTRCPKDCKTENMRVAFDPKKSRHREILILLIRR